MEKRRTKICMIVPQKDVKGGIAGVLSGYYGSRIESDYEVTYVESYCDGSKWDKLRKALSGYRAFRRVLRENRPDIVHVHSSFGPSFFRKAPFIFMASKRGIPVVNHIHGSAFEEFYGNAPGWKRRLVRKNYGRCSRIIVLSDVWKEKIGQIVPAEKIAVIANYSIEHREMLEPDRMQARFCAKQVLFLGVITEGKGAYEMPEVFRKVAEQVPDARFFLGGVGNTQEIFGGLAEDLKKKIITPGWIRGEEKEKALRESCVFFLPSHMEAMPVSILEAMGYGLPIVSTNAGGIPFVVEDGRNGILTDVKDTEAMAGALVKCLTERDTFEELAKQSIAVVDEKFSFERHIEAVEKVYEEVLR